MTKSTTSADALDQAMQAFQATRRTLQLATVNVEGEPLASYAPFVAGDNGEFFVFLSGLAGHTRNLAARPVAGVLLIEDESDSDNLYARQRVSLTCTAARLSRSDPKVSGIMARFRGQFGPVIDTLIELPDFDLFALVPTVGTFIRGFGEAYPVLAGKVTSNVPQRPMPTNEGK